MKKTITQNEKLQLVGLLTLGIQHQEIVGRVEDAMAKLTGTEVGGHLGDALYQGGRFDIDELLENEGVGVEDATT